MSDPSPQQLLRQESDRQHNNFDLLRLIFASIVVLYHCYELSLNRAYAWVPHVFSSTMAVQGFFAMSGCLIVSSYDRSSSVRSYLEKRARRLLPAYWAALIFTLILGSALSTLPVMDFLSSSETWKYAASNLFLANFLHPSLPGLFQRNPLTAAVNGSLWTIKIEVMFYLLVPLIVWLCRRWGRWQTLLAIYTVSIAYRTILERMNHLTLAAQLPGQLCFFVGGAFVYYYFHWFERNRRAMWAAAIVLYLASLPFDWIGFRAIGVSLGVMCVGFLLPPIGRPAKYGDFSYGIYVIHFPLIQAAIALGIVALHPQWSLALIVTAVALLSFASWRLIEKPNLRSGLQKARLRQTTVRA
jgi:peptidoglycan/LPS O-acetylase OafA/YrhL